MFCLKYRSFLLLVVDNNESKAIRRQILY